MPLLFTTSKHMKCPSTDSTERKKPMTDAMKRTNWTAANDIERGKALLAEFQKKARQIIAIEEILEEGAEQAMEQIVKAGRAS